jgi:hypothetical protein
MLSYNKYLKYKNKYLELKNSLIGGALVNYSITFKSSKPREEDITICYDYDQSQMNNKDTFVVQIKNFKILIGNEDIIFLYKNFAVNKNFFYNNLDLKKSKESIEYKTRKFNLFDKQAKDENSPIKIKNLGENNTESYTFTDCENIEILDNYLKLSSKDTNIKRYVESFLRKSLCSMTHTDNFIKSNLKHYPNLMKLYYSLIIISQYNKIVLNKQNDLIKYPGDQKIISKYENIYKNIPKYIPAHINNTDLKIRDSKETYVNLSSELNIIFDSGNDASTFISTKLLKYLGYLDSDNNINKSLLNKKIFTNFIKPGTLGVGGGETDSEITNLILLEFMFTSNKLNNDKIYKIYCYQSDSAQSDLLIGNDVLSILYEDGYNIKWKSFVSKGSKEITDNLKIYTDLCSSDSIFLQRPINTSLYSKEDRLKIVHHIHTFITGKYLELSNLTASDIIYIKKIIKDYLIALNTNINKDTIYTEFGKEFVIKELDKVKKLIKSAFNLEFDP